ncbi:site-specific integrase [Herbaspirillum camelliae]|uniref:tyrosine-type recombinase/integrase n=1 Tax=Herbaspirillum camelliae TaxID=1892903 RepID=UPI000949CE92|nr:tyrosine-type recombinase/integrase [Herbaspirillum camelliae]
MRSALPKELDFINQFRLNHNTLEHASWRISEFSADVWECVFGTTRRTIDFRKTIDDGSLLTDSKNLRLLEDIKRFLCLQTHPVLTGSVVLAPNTAGARVAQALHTLDYFLLRSNQFGVAANGFRLITANDVIAFIDALTSRRSIKNSIYEPKHRMLRYLAEVSVSERDFARVHAANPDLFELTEGEELELPCDQTLIARAWLKLNDCYQPANHGTVTEYRYRVTRKRLLAKVIGGHVLTELKFDGLRLPGFDVAPSRWFAQELTAVPVNNLLDDERAAVEYVSQYLAVLRGMQVARQYGISLLSEQALAALDGAELLLKERTKERARFTTLPFSLANDLLSQSIGFFLEYGEPLVNYYLTLARKGDDIREMTCPVPTKLTTLGIVAWRSNASAPDEFFHQLRRGESLFNMLEVLLGAIAVMVNTLMARRVSELEELTADSIVEEHGAYFLAIYLRKANVGRHRKRVLRPLPDIAAEALQLLAKLSRTLQELGYPNEGRLFEVPYSAWNRAQLYYGTCQPDLRRCFDRFCDFHQTTQDEQGRRYYVRAHQLRRNFAMLFFWKGSFGGIEVLRYFLGHSKPSMTYRYVTEAVSGKVLRRVKATVAKDLIKVDHPGTAELAQLVCERYGISLNELHILPERDVVDYVEDLILSGEAEVEPEFFNGPKGEEYRVLYRVIRQREEA